MGNECCKPERPGRDRNRRRSQQGTELQDIQPNRVFQRTIGSNQGISTIPLNAPQQTQVGQESNPREVKGEDFNDYMRVDNIQVVHHTPINEPHEAGHSFVVEFTVTNTTSDYVRFTSTPPLLWKEIEHKEETIEGTIKTTPPKDHDLYAEKPEAQTFYFWRTRLNETIAPNETKKILVQDNPRLRNIDRDANGQPRTVSRHIDFDVRVPGSDLRVRAEQNIEVVEGVVKKINFQEH